MNKWMLMLMGVSLLAGPVAGEAKDGLDTDSARTGYALGALIGENLGNTGVTIDYEAFLRGVKDAMEKKGLKIDLQTANQIVQKAMDEARHNLAQDNLTKEGKFLVENGKKPGVKTTASGLEYEVLQEGTGSKPKVTDTVKVHYVGTLLNGTTFDSSVARNQPAVFPLNQVIPGWTEGLQLMSVGAKYKFYIPSRLAYGENGPAQIGPNQTLIFEVTLLSIEPPADNRSADDLKKAADDLMKNQPNNHP